MILMWRGKTGVGKEYLSPRAPAWAMYLLPFQGVPLLLKHNIFEPSES